MWEIKGDNNEKNNCAIQTKIKNYKEKKKKVSIV
jgi:hypothetical protein